MLLDVRLNVLMMLAALDAGVYIATLAATFLQIDED